MIELSRQALHTPLVHLELIEADTIADMLACQEDPSRRHLDWHQDFPREDDRDGVGVVGEVSGWTSRLVRRVSHGLVIGSIGFFGPPEPADDGVLEAEVGFGLVRAERGHGLMRSALPQLLSLTDAVGVRVRATALADNVASLATLTGAGFVTGCGRVAADGEVVLVREARGGHW